VCALLGLAGAAAPARAVIHTRHVVVLVIDGARFSETLGDPTLTWHPRIGHDLAAIGAMPGRFDNVGQTVTVPGMSAIMTGTLQNVANDGSERPHSPTVCEYLRKFAGVPDSLVRVVARKPKLDVLAWSDHPDYGAAYGAVARAGFNNDLETFVEARAQLLHYRPTFMLIHLGDTDFFGHANDWPGYLGSLHLADSLVWRLWTDIQSDAGLAGTTTLFVTNDHGRHSDAFGGFQNHGDGCDGCRHIMLVMAGPDTRAGWVSAAHRDQRDIARTAGYLLGVPMPLAQGNVLDDLLLEPSQPLAVPATGALAGAPALAVYPNPTRAGSHVRLVRAGDGPASVEILDAAGRLVASPVGERDADGARVWTWDGRNTAGHPAPPGAYVVRARARGHIQLARLVKLH
jgi:hypothetical protein